MTNADTNKRVDAAAQPLVEVWRKGLKSGELIKLKARKGCK